LNENSEIHVRLSTALHLRQTFAEGVMG